MPPNVHIFFRISLKLVALVLNSEFFWIQLPFNSWLNIYLIESGTSSTQNTGTEEQQEQENTGTEEQEQEANSAEESQEPTLVETGKKCSISDSESFGTDKSL